METSCNESKAQITESDKKDEPRIKQCLEQWPIYPDAAEFP